MSLVLHNTQFHCFRDRVIAIFLCLLFSQAILWSPLQTDATLLDVPCCVRLHVAWGPVKSCVAPLLCRTYVVCVPVNFFFSCRFALRFARKRAPLWLFFYISKKCERYWLNVVPFLRTQLLPRQLHWPKINWCGTWRINRTTPSKLTLELSNERQMCH